MGGKRKMHTLGRNSYKTTSLWEKWATEHLPQKFGLDVVEVCNDYKRNHIEGTDFIVKNFCGKRYARVDAKWKRIFDYPDIWFALEDKQKDGTSWVDNQTAIDLDVIIVHPYKGKESTYKLCAYRLKDLHNIAEIKRIGCPTLSAVGTGTQYWKMSEDELENIKLWDSGWIWLGREEATWNKIKRL